MGGLLKGGGSSNANAKANGVTTMVTDKNGKIIDLGKTLGLSATLCLKKCPGSVTNTKTKCIKTTEFDGFPVCYAKNNNGKNIWPCQEKEKKKKKADDDDDAKEDN